MDLFETRAVPVSYIEELDELGTEERKDLIQQNNERLSRTLFDKNNKAAFWGLLEKIVILLKKNPDIPVRQIYSQLNEAMIADVNTLDVQSILFFISLIKDGLKNAN